MAKLLERVFELNSGDLSLEAALHEGDGPLAAVVLHPHPQYGGNMHNHVVVAACEALAGAGATTLRFNFRGTGRSDGSYDNGRGEAEDARAALAAVRELQPHTSILLVGYSFGAMVAASVAVSDTSLRGLVLISPPVAMAPLPEISPDLPVLLISGDRDEISPSAALAGYAADREVVIVPGVDHGWWPGLDVLTERLAAFAAGLRASEVTH